MGKQPTKPSTPSRPSQPNPNSSPGRIDENKGVSRPPSRPIPPKK